MAQAKEKDLTECVSLDGPVPNQIIAHMHCKRCLMEMPDDVSPREFLNLEVGLTATRNIQVWCKRHEMNVAIVAITEKGLEALILR